MQLSKSDYMLFLKHPAWLWLKKHDPKKLPQVDAATQAIFDAGHDFEQYAEKLFPGGVVLGFKDYDEYKSLPSRTKEALKTPAVTIFQGRFEYEETTFICDVLQVIEGGAIDLYEIKSTSRAKLDHEYDLAFQIYVLEGLGYSVRNIAVIHVNSKYVRQGPIDPKKITKITDITEKVRERMSETKENIKKAMAVAQSSECPSIEPELASSSGYKDWLEVYKNLVELPENSIFVLGGVTSSLSKQMRAEGIQSLDDLSVEQKLPAKLKQQVEAYYAGKPLVDKAKIKEFLNSFEYPLYFFDYETLASLVPYFDGMRPYQQLPFQYSLHVLDNPDAPIRHMEYLHMQNTNPAEAVVQAMKSHFGDKGTVLAWFMDFEKGCNKMLAQLVPSEAEFLLGINERMKDLMMPFASGWYIDYRFRGSASIKNVLPVLVPELTYKDLGIQEGASAQRLWMEAVLDGKHPETKDKILSDLIEYCKLDTFAMVEIHRVLKESMK